jgi:transposase
MVIMDAGYYSLNNLTQLTTNNIFFITLVTKKRKEFKSLNDEHGSDLEHGSNSITYRDRALCCKKVLIFLFSNELYVYLLLDFQKEYKDELNCSCKYKNNTDKNSKIDYDFLIAEKFILLLSNLYNINEILPLYYTRQTIERVFDISKIYGGLLPLRGHSEETLRVILLI